MKNAQLVVGGVVGESGIWVNGRMREVEKLGPFQILERDWDLGYICLLRSFTMVSQLYVAISRVTSSSNIKIFSGQGPHEYMQNVVYREVLEM
jgi:hypothetical protein